jgi:hypothetical protein
MMIYKRYIFTLILSLVSIVSVAQTQDAAEPTKKDIKKSKKNANKDTFTWRYELEPVGEGKQGTYQVKVWSYSTVVETAIEQAKKNAVHGIIFRGYEQVGRIQSQKPLTTNPNLEIEFQDFFKDFFQDGGKYLKFVSLVGNGAILPGDRIKIGKEYKVGVVINVNKDALRKDLEAAGVIKALNSGF